MRKKLYITMWNPKLSNFGNKHNNLGDDLNIPLLESITDCYIFPVQYSKNSSYRQCYSVIGSLLPWWINQNTEVWGSGIKTSEDTPFKRPSKVHAVRGPLTRKWLLDNDIPCPAIYGDPALLFPLIYYPEEKKRQKRYKYGVIFHEMDVQNAQNGFLSQSQETICIDICHYKDWKNVIDVIVSCEYIVSSSLHGLILADAYRVPSVWCKFSYDFGAGYVKFHDYFMSVGRDDETMRCISNWNDLETVENIEIHSKIDIRPLISACPFKNNLLVLYGNYIRNNKDQDIIYKEND